jgi:predicted AlkP superfamily phosphohydrolase/phosphomutase
MDLLIVGLDGLSFNMLDRFGIDVPVVDRVRETGVSGDLMSVDTPTTLPAWTSFATGKDPGSHGVSNMLRQGPDYEVSPIETATRDPGVYDLLSDAMFVNLPASVGREPAADGTHLVSAMLAKDEYDAVPEHLRELDAFDDYVLDHDKGKKRNPGAYFDHVCEITRARHAFAREAFETYDSRVGFVLFSTPDWAGHLLSNFSDDETRAGYYEQLLDVVGDCTDDLAGMADNVVLMSDHGFEPKQTNVHLNDWLRDEGYLTVRKGDVGATSRVAVDVAKAVGRRSDRLYELMRRVYNYVIGTDVGQSLQAAASVDVDHANSTAWQLRYGCIYVNDERFDSPQVTGEAADDVRRELREAIADLTDESGDPLFRAVCSPEEAYADPGEFAPDVIARPAPHHFPTMLESPTGGYASPTNNYNHRYRGMFAASGPLFASGGRTVEGMSIVDVIPTVFHALGEPLSPDFDGAVRTDVLTTGREPTYLAAADLPAPRLRGDDGVSQAERDAVVEDRLADLGYLE